MKKKIIAAFVILFGLIQFYRPNKNSDADYMSNKSDFLNVYEAPYEIRNLLINSCYDCHSNNTNYHWYDNIMPIGWWVDTNIKKGKFSLNFSTWPSYSGYQRLSHLSAMEFDININRMPTKEYLYIHSEAKLTPTQKEVLISWINGIDRMKIFDSDNSSH